MPPRTLADFAALQDEPWHKALADSDLSVHIEECGESTVRGWMELDTHAAAACIVTSDGVHEVPLSDGWDSSVLLSAGPAAIERLRARPHQPHEAFFTEQSLRGVYWIDPARRTLALWHGLPRWSGGVIGGGWAEWEVSVLEGGPQEMMRRLGRDPRALLSSDPSERLRKVAARLLPNEAHPGWQQVEAILEEPAFQPV
ncbi:MAG: hypothetical protein ACI8S6_001752 [Myxococcota bacterium]|jgi:hypothetical protein